TEYAFICILFLVYSIVPRNIRKCCIQQQLLASTGMRDRGVKRARFYVLVRTAMPAVLVEVGFVTGQEDALRLGDPATRTQMAQAIVQGILDYLQANNRP
ncbi:N-acetylmuramoyl-L-alanine amidase, partial [Microcoleus sp. F8-D3]